MVFRLLFRPSGVWEFQKGAIYDDEKNAIAACINARHERPDRDYGYIRENSA